MHYVWLNRLFPQNNLATVDGLPLQIINPGSLNTGAGPDFFNASVILNGQKWVGNVEIHVRASDWHRHNHTADPAYQSVILHVVGADDTVIHTVDGRELPQFVLRCNPHLNEQFHSLADFAVDALPCVQAIQSIPRIYMTDWITALAYERLYDKVERIKRLVEGSNGDWIEAGYITMARAFGFGTNSEPFERLARSIPMRILRRHSDNAMALEGILLGQAGLIPQSDNYYHQRLRDEYNFFAAKFGIRPVADLGWKFSRMRPQNSPVNRVSYLACMISADPNFLSKLLNISSVEAAYEILRRHAPCTMQCMTDQYEDMELSISSLNILIINAVIPFIYAYNTHIGNFDQAEKAIDMLHELKAENNRFTRMFASAGVKVDSAFSSQAIIQLRREYCEKRKCLYCRIGHRHLSAHALVQ